MKSHLFMFENSTVNGRNDRWIDRWDSRMSFRYKLSSTTASSAGSGVGDLRATVRPNIKLLL